MDTKLDVHQGYQIVVKSREGSSPFTGVVFGVPFVQGVGLVEPLPEDATEAEKRDRLLQLEWFANAPGYEVVPQSNRKRVLQAAGKVKETRDDGALDL